MIYIMAKKRKGGLLNTAFMIAGGIGLIGLGTLFIDLTLVNSMLLGWIPDLGHQVVGWLLAISGVGAIVKPFLK